MPRRRGSLHHLSLVVLTQAEAEPTATSKCNYYRPPCDGPRIHHYEVLEATATAESGFAFWPFRFHAAHDGRWIIAVIGGGGTSCIALPLRIAPVPQGSLTIRCYLTKAVSLPSANIVFNGVRAALKATPLRGRALPEP